MAPRIALHLAVAVSLAILLGASCVGPPMSCSDLLVDVQRIQALPFGIMEMGDVRAWATRTYGIADSTVGLNWAADGNLDLTWSVPERGAYLARFGPTVEEPLQRVKVRWSNNNFTGDRVLACLGAPLAYEAYLIPGRANLLVLRLWYPKAGLAVESYDFWRPSNGERPKFTGTLNMTSMVIGRPGLETQLPAVDGSEAVPKSLHPWPGDWSAIQVDEAGS